MLHSTDRAPLNIAPPLNTFNDKFTADIIWTPALLLWATIETTIKGRFANAMSWKFQYHTEKSRFRIMINKFYHFMIVDVTYCNRFYWLKKLAWQKSESHWGEIASTFWREATRPVPSVAHFYNPPTLDLPSSGRTTSRSSWSCRSVASFSLADSWSQILGSV